MNKNFSLRNGQCYTPTCFVIVGIALAILLALALLFSNNRSHSLPAVTIEPPTSSTPLPPQINPVTSALAISLPTGLPTKINPHPNDTVASFLSTATVPLTSTPIVLQTNDQPFGRSQYTLSAQLDYERHHLTVSQTITYVNQSRESLPDLLFVVEPNREPGVFRLRSLSWTDGWPIEGYTLEGNRLRVLLPNLLSSGASISLSLFYELNLPARPGPLGYTSRQTNLGDWYPFIPPYRAGQGWMAHEPGVIGEHLVYDVADYQVDIKLMRPAIDLIIAASASPTEFDGHWYRYRLDATRSFAWSVSSEYQILSQLVGQVIVVSYVFPEHLVAGEAALRATADSLVLYSELFGPYPHPSLAVVEADFSDGMEYEGLYFLGQEYYAAYNGNPQGYLITIAAHETSHQWWYGLVGNNQAIEPWLDESLAVYSELLFYEAMYPDSVDWWWEFRVSRFNPVGWVNSTIYDHNDFRPYVNAIYLRGALFMEELRRLVGDEVFFAFLRDYATRGIHSQMTAEDFFTILAEHSSADLSMVMPTYFALVE